MAETSVTSPDELIEQVFDDLDSEALIKDAPPMLAAKPGLTSALQDFLAAMLQWDAELDLEPAHLRRDARLFDQPGWDHLRRQAQRLLAEAKAAGFEPEAT